MAEVIRIGKVSAIDYEAGRVRVVYHQLDDSVTALIPLISAEYKMPKVGDQVLVLHLSDGTEAGVVLGRPWSEKNKPPEHGEGLYRKDLADKPGEAMIRYKDGVMTIKAKTLQIVGSLTIEGDLAVTGGIHADGEVEAKEVRASGVAMSKHTHDCSCTVSSGTTKAPKKGG